MRALILVAGAALAVSACSSNEAANNTVTDDANLLATDNTMMTDMNAMDANMMDANMTMNAGDANMTMNSMEMNDMMTNTPDTNVANGM